MFVGTIVSGLIVQSTNGIACRGAFLRDVSMYALSILMVWRVLESNTVTRRDVYMLLGMWVGYVTIVFLADMYHRKVTLPRLALEGKEKRKSLKLEKIKRLSALANDAVGSADERTPLVKFTEYGLETEDINTTNESVSIDNTNDSKPRGARLSVTDRFAMLMSNYDPASVKFDLSSKGSIISNDDSDTTTIHNVMHQIHSIRRTSLTIPTADDLLGSVQKDALLENEAAGWPERLHSFPEELEEEESVINEGERQSCSKVMCLEAYQEIVYQAKCFWRNRFVNESSRLERFGILLELPITIVRTVS